MVLTTHATEQAIVGNRQGDVGVVVAVKTDPQAEGRLQDHKLAAQVDLDSADGGDRGDDHGPVDLEDTETFVLSVCVRRRSSPLVLTTNHGKHTQCSLGLMATKPPAEIGYVNQNQLTYLDRAAFAEDDGHPVHVDDHGPDVGDLLTTSSVLVLRVHAEVRRAGGDVTGFRQRVGAGSHVMVGVLVKGGVVGVTRY